MGLPVSLASAAPGGSATTVFVDCCLAAARVAQASQNNMSNGAGRGDRRFLPVAKFWQPWHETQLPRVCKKSRFCSKEDSPFKSERFESSWSPADAMFDKV